MPTSPGCRRSAAFHPMLGSLAPLYLLSLLLLAACTNTTAAGSAATATLSSSTTSAHTGGSPAIMERMASSTSVGAGMTGAISVTAYCPLGTTMLSGGYGLGGGDTATNTQILQDRPDTPSSWTVVAENAAVGGPYTLTTYADCLKSKAPVVTHIVESAFSPPADGNYHEASAACPNGSVVTGGGFASGIGADASLPINGAGTARSANVWDTQIGMTQGQTQTPAIYAVCVDSTPPSSFREGSIPTAAQPITTTSGDLSIGCPAGQLLVGGGLALDHVGANVYGSTLSADGSQWTVSATFFPFAGTPPAVTETAYAVCVRT
ncbi:MAG: hypothetical protein C5B60_11675 [Chloroflexi bacterium]|nr:MAG: hypothetical protein C5B60_11675 [Chloroflexota bacterium]